MEHAKHKAERPSLAKRAAFAVAAALACCALVAGGTLAYFVAEEKTHNVITSGSVKIAISEYTRDAAGELVEFPRTGVDGVMPGAAVDKIIEVENVGRSAAWVRVKAESSIALAAGASGTPDQSLVAVGVDVSDPDSSKWVLEGGWYYCTQQLPSKVEGDLNNPATPRLPLKVALGSVAGNPYQGSTVSVDVIVQAVQVANNGETVLEARGWPAGSSAGGVGLSLLAVGEDDTALIRSEG